METIASAGNIERAERGLKRSVLRRNAVVEDFERLYQLSINSKKDSSVHNLFRAQKADIEQFMAEFTVEQDAIMDTLLTLGRDEEYELKHAGISREIKRQYYFIHAAAQEILMDQSSVQKVRANIHLPKISLPSFNGDILQWPTFRDKFIALVDSDVTLAPIEKFHYLAGCVVDRAASVVNSLKMTDANYTIVWKKLNDQFDNPRLSATTLVDNVLNFRRMDFESVNGLTSFLHVYDESLRSLESFNIEDLSSFILFIMANKNLPRCTRELFERENNSMFPTIDDLITFVRDRIKVLENIGLCVSKGVSKDKSIGKLGMKANNKMVMIATHPELKGKCPVCKGNHDIKLCGKFLKLQPPKRFTLVSSFRRCFRCFSPSHMSSSCDTEDKCNVCQGLHHTLLHFRKSPNKSLSFKETSNNTYEEPVNTDSDPSMSSGAVSIVGKSVCSTVLLGTALVHTRDNFDNLVDIRILIDSGSQISAISESCAHRLGLLIKKKTVPVSGLAGASIPKVQGLTSCVITPRFKESPKINVNAWVLPKITLNIPSCPLPPLIKEKFNHMNLADPTFDTPSTIDLLLGADLYNYVFDGKRYSGCEENLTAYSSIFGWILIGTARSAPLLVNQSFLVSLDMPLEDMLLKFWEVEEPVIQLDNTTENGRCEQIFREKAHRNSEGRYVVPLPFKYSSPQESLKGSKNMAQKRFFNMERKLLSDSKLYEAYRNFMDEYIKLGHMKLATTPGDYFIPHHGVTKNKGHQLDIRVVFDASARTSSGKSLNDLLYTGPKLQNDITDILLRFRLPKFVFLADICKMYRQILICPEHRSFQHILWRPHPEEELAEYELMTVTYGTGPAPYLAIKVLHKIAESCQFKFPNVYEAIINNTYVDDICAGGDDLNSVLTLQKDLISVLSEYGLELKKWSSNCSDVLNNIVPNSRSDSAVIFDDDCNKAFVKVLGLHWDPIQDVIGYHVSPESGIFTKRGVLSVIARLYDPVGLLAPVTFWAKEFLQRLWRSGFKWDTTLPQELASEWQTFLEDLPCVSKSKLSRFINIELGSDVQLCGFCDASNKGYAAVVYLRVCTNGIIKIFLLGAKSKVAPVKTLTVPRLELSGALLLAKWMNRITIALKPRIHIEKLFAWTDSTIVLSWLVNSQIDYKIFVTNRIAKIKKLLPDCCWRHISSENNPADCVSRGLLPSQLWNHNLYWKGPDILKSSSYIKFDIHYNLIPLAELPEVKAAPSTVMLINTSSSTHIIDSLSRFSSLPMAQRVFAWVWRFVGKTQKQYCLGALKRIELQRALDTIVIVTQQHFFENWTKMLKNSSSGLIPKSYRTLQPFIDENGIIRVGGRLRHSALSDQAKFPILLPKGSHLSSLILQHYHRCYLHAGPRMLGALVSRTFWITSIRSEIRKVIGKCITCTKWKVAHPKPIMADLPSPRVKPSRPFCHVGIDYGGPFTLRESRRRKSKEYKGYMSLFICFSTKAVHLETVTELSTEAFLAAFDRFTARRGIPSDVYTDCGTNFVGADRQLKLLFKQEEVQSSIVNANMCHWHFNPPAAPHFGGLWEAGIKSAKYHLKRAIGNQILTFEEFSTILTRVEGILNSRPLTPLSSDPNDVDCLTPGHFLIGQPLVALPDRDVMEVKLHILNRWQLLRQCVQQFWNRWSREYLSSLQQRSKWNVSSADLKINDVVIIKTPHLPPTQWKTGRITEVHPGKDNIVRVVTLRTYNGFVKRPVVQLVKLPIDL